MSKFLLSVCILISSLTLNAQPYLQPAINAKESKNLTDSITVSGRVTNITANGSHTLIINECDTYSKSERRVADLDSLGRFCERIPFSSAHTFTVNYKRFLFINAFAEPGDSIHVEIDASRSPIEFHLSGDHAALNEEYSHAFEDLSSAYRNIELLPDTASLAEYMQTFKNEVAKTRAIIDEYIKNNSISDETASMLYIDNIFTIANIAIGFRGKNRDEQFKFFTDPLFDILNEGNAKVMIFPYHLKALCRKFPEYVETAPKGHIRDLMYASATEKLHPEREEFADPVYYDRIYKSNSKEIHTGIIKSGEIIVMRGDSITKLTNEHPLRWLAKQYPGKTIYLDLSATWCGPCRAALNGSEGIREHFKGSNLVFAIAWLKSNIETWEKIAPNIHNAVQIFINDDDMSNRIMGAFNMKGFPSYYLLMPDGNIINENVPKLQDPSLPDFLKSKI